MPPEQSDEETSAQQGDENETPALVTDVSESPDSESPAEGEGSEAQDDQPEPNAFDRWTAELRKLPQEERTAAHKRYFDSLPDEERSELPWNVEERERSQLQQANTVQLNAQQQQEARLQGHRARAGQAFKRIKDHLDEVEADEGREKKADRNLIEDAVADYGEAAAQVHFNDQLVSIGTTIVSKLEQFGPFDDETRQALVSQTSGKGMEARLGLYLDELVKRARVAETEGEEKRTKKAVEEAVAAERGALRTELLRELKVEPESEEPSGSRPQKKVIDMTTIGGIHDARRNGKLTDQQARERIHEIAG